MVRAQRLSAPRPKKTVKKLGGRYKTGLSDMSERPRPLSASEEEFAATCFWNRSGDRRQAGSQQKLPASERVRIAGMVATLERYASSYQMPKRGDLRYAGSYRPREGGIWPFSSSSSSSDQTPWYSGAYDTASSWASSAASNLGSLAGEVYKRSIFAPEAEAAPWYSRAASWITEAAAPVTAFLTSSAGLYSLGAAGLAALAVYYLRRTSSAAAAENRKAGALRNAAKELSEFVNLMQRFILLRPNPAALPTVQPYIAKTQQFLEGVGPALNNPLLADNLEPPGAPEILAQILALRTEGDAINLKLKASIPAQAPVSPWGTGAFRPAFAPTSSPFSTPSPLSQPEHSPFHPARAAFPPASAPPWDVSAPAPWESKQQPWPSPSLPSYSQLPFTSRSPWLSAVAAAPSSASLPWGFTNSPSAASPFASGYGFRYGPFASNPFASNAFASSPSAAPSYNNNPAPFAMGAWPTTPSSTSVQDPPGPEPFAF
jgi:hypothetical protein